MCRFGIAVTCYSGVNWRKVAIWNLYSTLLCAVYFVSGMLNVFIIVIAKDLTTRVVSVLLTTGEVILNCISIICVMILAYQTIVSSQDYSTLDIRDSQKEFILMLLRGLKLLYLLTPRVVNIIPGIGLLIDNYVMEKKLDYCCLLNICPIFGFSLVEITLCLISCCYVFPWFYD